VIITFYRNDINMKFSQMMKSRGNHGNYCLLGMIVLLLLLGLPPF